jgi:hypothetical protein
MSTEEVFVSRYATEFFAKSTRELRASGMRVLLSLISRVGPGNCLVFDLDEVGQELCLKPATVQKAIERLLCLLIISEASEPDCERLYQFNPELVWKGDLAEQPKALEAWRRRERIKAAMVAGKIQAVIEGGELVSDKQPTKSAAKKTTKRNKPRYEKT